MFAGLTVMNAPRYPGSVFVNQGYGGASDEMDLYTRGAGPCLVLVAHSRRGRGGLAHVWNGSIARKELWAIALAAAEKLVKVVGGVSELMLLAGGAFTLQARFGLPPLRGDDPTVDLPTFLGQRLAIRTVADHRHPNCEPEDFLYDPGLEWVYCLNDPEFQGVQAKRVHAHHQVVVFNL
jgi:hypothetical protein